MDSGWIFKNPTAAGRMRIPRGKSLVPEVSFSYTHNISLVSHEWTWCTSPGFNQVLSCAMLWQGEEPAACKSKQWGNHLKAMNNWYIKVIKHDLSINHRSHGNVCRAIHMDSTVGDEDFIRSLIHLSRNGGFIPHIPKLSHSMAI